MATSGCSRPPTEALRLETESHGRVRATIGDGWFALWFPGDELADRDRVVIDVTRADGSTATIRLEL